IHSLFLNIIFSFDYLFFRFPWNQRYGEMFTWRRKRGNVEMTDHIVLIHLFLLVNVVSREILLRNLIFGRNRMEIIDLFFLRLQLRRGFTVEKMRTIPFLCPSNV
ncbi:hypothetical protein PENTCL1PPCAC_12496, partial [Pristionchus entomophagus]